MAKLKCSKCPFIPKSPPPKEGDPCPWCKVGTFVKVDDDG